MLFSIFTFTPSSYLESLKLTDNVPTPAFLRTFPSQCSLSGRSFSLMFVTQSINTLVFSYIAVIYAASSLPCNAVSEMSFWSHGQLSCPFNFLMSHKVLVIGHSEALYQVEMQLL